MADREPKRDDCGAPPRKKRKIKYDHKFKAEYADEFKCVTCSAFRVTFAFCKLCRTDVNIAHGGQDDIRNHSLHWHHLSALTSFVNPDRQADVTRAELTRSTRIQFDIDISLVSSLLAFVLMPNISVACLFLYLFLSKGLFWWILVKCEPEYISDDS